MKTERRHELHTNVLADWLGDQVERIQPYSRLLAGVLLAIVVGAGLYAYLSSRSDMLSEQGSQQYSRAIDQLSQKGNPDDLTELAQSAEFAKTPASYWAAIALGDFHLSEGIAQLFNDREVAQKSLRAAVDNYMQVSEQTEVPTLTERAILGAARAYESLNQLDKASQLYEQLASKGTGPYALEGQIRLRDLGQESTKQFYDWFWNAKLPRINADGPGLPGLRPDGKFLPDEGAFRSPATDSDSLLRTPRPKSTDTEVEEDKATESPASEPAADAQPEQPATDAAPSADAPSTEEKPAADAPAASEAPAEPKS